MKNKQNKALGNILSSVLAIVGGLLFGLIVLLVTNPKEAFSGFMAILGGGINYGIDNIGLILNYATPIIMTGLSVGFAFKTGLFNIGAAGQFTVGAFVAIYIGVKWTFLPFGLHCLVAIIFACLAGALWGLVPGFLKAVANVNEVISSILMNYIGMHLVNMLIKSAGVYDSLRNQSKPVAQTANLPKMGLDKLVPGANINSGILIALIFVIIMYIIIEKTTFGYELKACGMNKNASKYAGINENRSIILSMVIAGGLAGIGGALYYLSGTGRYMQVLDIIAQQGFDGISVALLGISNPIGIFFAGIFIAHITNGGLYLQLFGFVPEVIQMIIASIIYFGAFALLVKGLLTNMKKRKAAKMEQQQSVSTKTNEEGAK